MKIVVYYEGPDRLNCGLAGDFERGVPKELPDEVADTILSNPWFTEIKEKEGKEGIIDVNGSR